MPKPFFCICCLSLCMRRQGVHFAVSQTSAQKVSHIHSNHPCQQTICVPLLANIAWTACGEPCHDVCNNIFTQYTALPCRVLKPATLHWIGNHLISALTGHSLRHPLRSHTSFYCLVCHSVIVLDYSKYWHV